MSYILEALKKAERERDVGRIPTVTTAHVPISGAGRRLGLWVVVGALLFGGGLAIWLLRPSSGVVSPAAPDFRADTRVSPPPSRVDPEQMSGPVRTGNETPGEAAPLPPPGGPVQEFPRQAERESVSAPLPITAPARAPARPGDFGEAKSGESPPVQEHSLGVIPADPLKGKSKPDAGRPVAPGPGEGASRQEAEPIPGVDRGRADAGASSAPSPPPGVPALGAAIPKMILNVLVYADAEADRVVMINGQQYVKGQRVDGHYLVEEITPEGVLLSFEGERALLRP
jgi:general secretion pathway protein B